MRGKPILNDVTLEDALAVGMTDVVRVISSGGDGPGCELVDGEIPNAKGVGLANTRERLATIYGSNHSIRLSQTDPHGLTIAIRIPFTTKHKPA